MKQLLNFKSTPGQLIFGASCLLNSILWLYTLKQYLNATDIVPLHYTIYFGIDFIDFKAKLFTYPLMGISIIVVNALLSRMCKQEKLIGYLLLSNALLMQILLTATEAALIIHYY